MLMASALTPVQRQVLSTIAVLCPRPGQEVHEIAIAATSGLSRRYVVLSVRGLVRRGLLQADGGADGRRVCLTFNGHQCVRTLPPPPVARDDREERSAG